MKRKLARGFIGYERYVGMSKKRGTIICIECNQEVKMDMITLDGRMLCKPDKKE